MCDGRRAIDTATGRQVSDEEAQRAADNPRIYTWIRWENA